MQPRILISGPIYKRAWILEHWLKCIEDQSIPLRNIGFQFEFGPDDDATQDLLWEFHEAHPECFIFDGQIDITNLHATHEEGVRSWAQDEYLRMVSFRNNLLDRAQQKLDSFDYYFSLDSDVLIYNPDTLETLAAHNKDVISPLMYMTPPALDESLPDEVKLVKDEEYPNAMDWLYEPSPTNGGSGRRTPRRINPNDITIPYSQREMKTGLHKVAVPMAAIMMSPEVVNTVKYVWHPQGEDIGFATQLHKHKYDAYLDFDLDVAHIMHRWQLNHYLAEGDRRLRQIVKA